MADRNRGCCGRRLTLGKTSSTGSGRDQPLDDQMGDPMGEGVGLTGSRQSPAAPCSARRCPNSGGFIIKSHASASAASWVATVYPAVMGPLRVVSPRLIQSNILLAMIPRARSFSLLLGRSRHARTRAEIPLKASRAEPRASLFRPTTRRRPMSFSEVKLQTLA
jgi:hypothetical protein